MDKQILPVSVVITYKNGLPFIELRKGTSNNQTIKNILSAAAHDQPIIILPQFSNKIRAISKLKEIGLIYEKDNQYFFIE